MRNDAASGRVGVPGPFGIHTLLLAYFNDGARIWNGDVAEHAGSPDADRALAADRWSLAAVRSPLGSG